MPVLSSDDVRPTPNRARETLFNWLQSYVDGSQCLDLFAGSGALGFEALSRGAFSATLVDHDPHVVNMLRQQADKLKSQQLDMVCADGLQFICNAQSCFDIIFLDPPFSKYQPGAVLERVLDAKLLKPNGHIYVEYADHQQPGELPPGWHWKRQSRAGKVQYGLITRESL